MTASDQREVTTIAVTNIEQAAAWDGTEGDHWTEHEEHYNAVGRRYYDPRLIDAAQIPVDGHVLDIGCGCGVSTRDAARIAVSGLVLGVDLSARMTERARQRSREEGLTNTRFEQADAQVHEFDAHTFDRAISRFGAMFFGDPVAAFTNIGRALRPGGLLAQVSWQQLGKNEWVLAICEALAAGRTLPEPPAGAPGPFGLAEPDTARLILTQAGFEQVEFEEVNEPLRLGADADNAFRFVRGLGITEGLLDGLDATATEWALEKLRGTMTAHDTGEGVLFDASAWLVTARRP